MSFDGEPADLETQTVARDMAVRANRPDMAEMVALYSEEPHVLYGPTIVVVPENPGLDRRAFWSFHDFTSSH